MSWYLPFEKNKLNLSEADWKYISEVISSPKSIMIYGQEEIEGYKLLALGTQLDIDGTGIMRRYHYHDCQKDPVEIEDGWKSEFPIGEFCPCCSELFTNSDTTFDYEIIIKYPMKVK